MKFRTAESLRITFQVGVNTTMVTRKFKEFQMEIYTHGSL